jgi:polysaccharide biosynthesis/export protein
LEKKAEEINVRLVNPQSAVYYVLGEVSSPGSFALLGRETVLDGILEAGGLSDKASQCNIILSRPSAPNGCRTVMPICYRHIVQLGDTTTNFQLMPGDRIYVATRTLTEQLLSCVQSCPCCEGCQCPCPTPAAAIFPQQTRYSQGTPRLEPARATISETIQAARPEDEE